VIPELYPILTRGDDSVWLPAIEGMPKIYRDSFAYLIGFLKAFLVPEKRTDANVGSVSLLFGSGCLRKNHTEMKEAKEFGDFGRNLLRCLILNWDVSDIYPLPDAAG
jgi:hypothetical protein